MDKVNQLNILKISHRTIFLIYPGMHELVISETGKTFFVQLKLELTNID